MKTLNRICIKSCTILDQDGTRFTLNHGEEYLTSEEKDGEVTVFSQYWVNVPIGIFAGEEEFTT